jgi:zinc protease
VSKNIRLKIIRFVLGLSLLLPSLAGAASSGGTEIRETILPNGLKVLIKELHAAPVVTIWTFYRVGSRNERLGVTGISHVVEHMFFRSTATMKTGEIDRRIQLAGGRHNAFTTHDYTAYHISLPSDQLETALRIEGDRMLNCAFDPGELKTELGVVVSELQGRLNDPEELLEETTRETAFLLHPYRFPIIGLKADVQSLTREAVWNYYQTYYHPGNAVVVIVGDVRTEAALDLVRRHFGGLPNHPRTQPTVPRESPQQGERRVVVKGAGTIAYLQAAFHVPPAGHPDLYPLAVLDAILAQGKSSRLHRALVETDLAAGLASDLTQLLDPGWFAFYLTAREGVAHDRIERSFTEAIERVRREGVTERELQKATNQVRADMTINHGSVSGLARAIGSFEMTVGYREIDRYGDRIRQVTTADVQRVAREYLTADNRTVGWFVPDGKSAGEGDPSAGGRRSVNRSPEAPGRSEAHPQASSQAVGSAETITGRAVRHVLPNGLTLIAAENRVAPSVSIKGYVLAGPVQDPPGKAGLATLTAELVTRGTPAQTAAELAEQIDFLGASATIQAEQETVGITAQMLSEHFDAVLDSLAVCLRNPAFPAEEVEKALRRLKARLSREAQDPKDRAQRELFARLYPPGHPLHRNPHGRLEDLEGIGREDVIRFHEKLYRPERTVLVVVGDISPAEALASIQRAFGGWARLEESTPLRPPMPAVAPSAQYTVQLNGKSEAIVVMGGNGVFRNDPDYYAAYMANRILGVGDLNSRLMKALRQQNGMTYGVYSYFYPVLGERPWVAFLQTSPAMVERAIAATIAEANRLREHGVTAEELEESRSAAIGSLVLSMEDQMGMAFILRDTELFNLGLDFPERFPIALRAVTPERTQAAARKFIHPDRLIRIVVTPPQP